MIDAQEKADISTTFSHRVLCSSGPLWFGRHWTPAQSEQLVTYRGYDWAQKLHPGFILFASIRSRDELYCRIVLTCFVRRWVFFGPMAWMVLATRVRAARGLMRSFVGDGLKSR